MWQLSTGQNHKLIIQVSQDYHLALIFSPRKGLSGLHCRKTNSP